jgi:hypothetical protein
VKFIDLTGQRFGRLVVIERTGASNRRGVYWLCKCDCGIEKEILAINLKQGSTKSCGCFRREMARNLGELSVKHGHAVDNSPSLEYRIWHGIKQRCFNPNNNDYPWYGGRGITVCDRWKDSFSNFLEDVGPRPNRKYSIDRINPDGNYEPENCRWTTSKEQYKNRRVKFIKDFSTDQLTAELKERGCLVVVYDKSA